MSPTDLPADVFDTITADIAALRGCHHLIVTAAGKLQAVTLDGWAEHPDRVLPALQAAVHGYIQHVHLPTAPGLAAYANEDGLDIEPPNLTASVMLIGMRAPAQRYDGDVVFCADENAADQVPALSWEQVRYVAGRYLDALYLQGIRTTRPIHGDAGLDADAGRALVAWLRALPHGAGR